MSSSFSFSNTTTFTATNAKYLASKVAADLKRMQRFYNAPSDYQIEQYERELIEFLKKGYMESIYYGYQKDGNWIVPTLFYTARDFSTSSNDDDPGKITANADITGAEFKSFMTYSTSYHQLNTAALAEFQNGLPFKRNGVSTPGINGYLSSDKSYSSGGKGLDRSSLKKY